ncbi:hypothetical protein [Cognatishimia activa]|uniref:DUF4410 domain-containing protein n=1 Tax=Cognatishimia activa TaxID=1715691 RepID=A0A0P1J0L5_9RHOB|nr:hypothetical protein [Cognatishimia activa]CUI47815.1 hypothetical protein TA5113_00563 [Cognatishimia activa]CUK27427.1 hypothetical protein TA5114_03255 [Cognatishimia activa]
MTRIFALLALVLTLTACAEDSENPTKLDLGDFTLGHNIVIAPDLQKGPTSRNATPEELTEALKAQLDKRLGRYDGERMVHLGVNIGAYVLARPGVPLVYTPKSVLIVTVTAWDDRAGGKFHEKPAQILAFENFGGTPILGSGHTKTREEQIAALSANAARNIEKWLAENAECMTDNPSEEALSECWKDKKPEQIEE